MKKTRRMAVTSVLTALYFVLSALFRIPVVGNITIDLGYIVLMVGVFYLGAESGMVIGAGGALLESMLMSRRGISIGWILMNAMIGYCCGKVLYGHINEAPRKLWIRAAAAVLGSSLAGVAVKTAVDLLIYGGVTLAAKIPSSVAAWLLDAAVMLVIGLPVSRALRNRVKFPTEKSEGGGKPIA